MAQNIIDENFGQEVEPGFCASIKNITQNSFVVEEINGSVWYGPMEDRLLFYDEAEAEAEAVLELLNDVYADCFSLIVEGKTIENA